MTKPDTFLTEFIPPHAVQCWTDDTFVYCAVPSVSGPPLIQKYMLSNEGMTKAINILKVQRRKLAKTRVVKEATPITRTKYAKPKPRTEVQESVAMGILRRRGLI